MFRTKQPARTPFRGALSISEDFSRFAHFGKSNSISPLYACAAQLVPSYFWRRVSVKIRGKYFSRLFYSLSVCDLLFLFLLPTTVPWSLFLQPLSLFVFYCFLTCCRESEHGLRVNFRKFSEKFEVWDLFLIHTLQ